MALINLVEERPYLTVENHLQSRVNPAEARSQAEKELTLLMSGHPTPQVDRNKTVNMA